jgi:predicted phosphodiesterase
VRIAVLSDIHSNVFALRSVLQDASGLVESFIILGDVFGYYPWAVETYDLVRSIPLLHVIKGNHDIQVAERGSSGPDGESDPAVRQNRAQLAKERPEALEWLVTLKTSKEFSLAGRALRVFHGTPDDPENGRYYPDDTDAHPWLPLPSEIVMLGNTHYPINRTLPSGGIIMNPGSTGQPRDGDTRASWALFDLSLMAMEIKRTKYDIASAVTLLRRMNWDQRSIAALEKDYQGRLKSGE